MFTLRLPKHGGSIYYASPFLENYNDFPPRERREEERKRLTTLTNQFLNFKQFYEQTNKLTKSIKLFYKYNCVIN